MLKECEERGRLFPTMWETMKLFRTVWEADVDNFWVGMDGVVRKLGAWWTDRD